MPRQILLGHLRARREGLAFVAGAPGEVLAAAGEEIEVAVAYDYDEPSLAQDHFEATLLLDAPGGADASRTVTDAPFSRERESGLLVRRLVVQAGGDVRFELRARLGHRPWTLRGPRDEGGEEIRESGVIRLRIS